MSQPTEHDAKPIPSQNRRGFLLGSGVGIAALASTARAQEENLQSADGSKLLSGKVALVTGAARGIGRAIAEALSAEGASVIALDIAKDIEGHPVSLSSQSDLNQTVDALTKRGSRAVAVTADIRNLEQLKMAIDQGMKELGGLDIVVANAGIAGNMPFLENEDQDYVRHWELLTDVNVRGTANTLRATLPKLAGQKQGSVILTSSTFGRQGNATNPAYVGTKWATTGLMKSAALEMGPHGVTVNAIAPTGVKTGLTGGLEGEELAQANKFFKESYHALPEGILSPEDIAGAAVFLASPWAAKVTGTTIDVAAGANARYTA